VCRLDLRAPRLRQLLDEDLDRRRERHGRERAEHAEQGPEEGHGENDEERGEVDRLPLDLRGEDVVLVYQQVENNILTPKIQGKAVELSGFFIIVAVTLFGALLGVLGALTAVPLAATIQIFIQELTKARREKVAEARAAAASGGGGAAPV